MSHAAERIILRIPPVRRPMISLPDRALAGLPNGMPPTKPSARCPTTPDYFSNSETDEEPVTKDKEKKPTPVASRPAPRRIRSRQSSYHSSSQKARHTSTSKVFQLPQVEVLQSISCIPGLREKSLEVGIRMR
jgi:hypothetical protein